MTPGARIAAAIEVVADIAERRRPAADALRDWGLAHRFAGSGDRAAIGGLVYDTLRRRASAGYAAGDETPRALVLGMLKVERGLSVEAIAALCEGARHAPAALSANERAVLAEDRLAQAPPTVAGDYPDWLDPYLERSFGADRGAEAAALARRAPMDLRVNTALAARDAVAQDLAYLGATPGPWSPWSLRIPLRPDARSPGIQAEPGFAQGQFEVQDEGSQLAVLFAGARPGETVIDLCAGAGGKTLALAAMMEGEGRLIATDSDKRRLAPIHDRLHRARLDGVEVRSPRGEADPLADFAGKADLVLVDAPCTGTGTWRRNPDAKWRMRPGALEVRQADQRRVLARGAALVRPGGRLVYVTCSVLTEENADPVEAFLGEHTDFAAEPPERWTAALDARAPAFREAARAMGPGLLMSPLRTATDGFFVAVLRRRA